MGDGCGRACGDWHRVFGLRRAGAQGLGTDHVKLDGPLWRDEAEALLVRGLERRLHGVDTVEGNRQRLM